MNKHARQERILSHLRREGEVTVHFLTKVTGVSAMTIRRDLGDLERRGYLVRTHGGAAFARAGVIEFSFSATHRHCLAEKRALAREASKRIRDGMSVVLDTGTTTLEIAHLLRQRRGIRVLTTSLAIASALYAFEGIDVVLLGGTVRKGSPDLSGPLAEENLSRFHVDVAFLGADAAGPDGLFTESLGVGRLSERMIGVAERSVVVVDHSKFGRHAFAKYAAWTDISEVITDSGTDRGVLDWLCQATRVMIVQVGDVEAGEALESVPTGDEQ